MGSKKVWKTYVDVGRSLFLGGYQPTLWNRPSVGPPTVESKNRKNLGNFDLCNLFLGPLLFGPPTMVAVVFDFKDQGLPATKETLYEIKLDEISVHKEKQRKYLQF